MSLSSLSLYPSLHPPLFSSFSFLSFTLPSLLTFTLSLINFSHSPSLIPFFPSITLSIRPPLSLSLSLHPPLSLPPSLSPYVPLISLHLLSSSSPPHLPP